MADSEISAKIEYFDNLKAGRDKWGSIWDELAKYVCPQTKSNKEIFDSTSIWSREQLASGLQSLLVNPAMNWFNITCDPTGGGLASEGGTLQADDDLTLWNQQVEQTILSVFNNPACSFYNQVHEFFLTLTAYGTAIFYIGEEPSLSRGMLFRNINIRQCYFEEDRLGNVSTMYRLFEMPIKAAASRWPDCKIFAEKLEKTPDEQIEILHIVEPDKDKKQTSLFSSMYIYLDTKEIIAEGSYSYFPFMVCRWIKQEGEAYGYAPAHHVLPDIKLLNSLRQITLKAAQMQQDPSLLVPKNGYYLPLVNTPGHINFYRNGTADKIMRLTGMENIVPTHQEQDQCREAILKAYYVDIFRTHSWGMQKENKEMTATEVNIRTEEQMRMMSPMVGRIETEFLNPLIINIYKILVKYNMLPEMQEVTGIKTDINIEYVSPLARAQKASSINSIESVLGFFQRSGIVNMFPDIYDNIDFDALLRKFFDLRGCPQEVLKSEAEVMQLRRQRRLASEQLAAMQGQEMQTGMGGVQ